MILTESEMFLIGETDGDLTKLVKYGSDVDFLFFNSKSRWRNSVNKPDDFYEINEGDNIYLFKNTKLPKREFNNLIKEKYKKINRVYNIEDANVIVLPRDTSSTYYEYYEVINHIFRLKDDENKIENYKIYDVEERAKLTNEDKIVFLKNVIEIKSNYVDMNLKHLKFMLENYKDLAFVSEEAVTRNIIEHIDRNELPEESIENLCQLFLSKDTNNHKIARNIARNIDFKDHVLITTRLIYDKDFNKHEEFNYGDRRYFIEKILVYYPYLFSIINNNKNPFTDTERFLELIWILHFYNNEIDLKELFQICMKNKAFYYTYYDKSIKDSFKLLLETVQLNLEIGITNEEDNSKINYFAAILYLTYKDTMYKNIVSNIESLSDDKNNNEKEILHNKLAFFKKFFEKHGIEVSL